MASHSDGVPPEEPSGAKTPSSRLETLPKEDLIVFVKKQMLLLKRTKIKNEELAKQLSGSSPSVKESKDSNKEYDGEIANLKAERDDIIAAYNASQQSQEAAAERIEELEQSVQRGSQKIKALSEENECMHMKEQTMMSSFQCLQEDLVQLKKTKEEHEDQIHVVTEARDETLKAFKEYKQKQSEKGDVDEELKIKFDQLLSEKEEASRKLEELEGVYKQCAQSKDNLSQQIDEIRKDLNQEKEESQKLTTKLAKAMKLIEKLKVDRAQKQKESAAAGSVAEELTKLKESFTDLQEKESVWEEEKAKYDTSLDTLNGNIKDLKDELDSVKAKLAETQEQSNGNVDENCQMQKANEDLQGEKLELTSKLEAMQSEINELQKQKNEIEITLQDEQKEREILCNNLEQEKTVSGQAKDDLTKMMEKLNVVEEEFVNCKERFESRENELGEEVKSQSEHCKTVVEELENCKIEMEKFKHEVEEYAKATEVLHMKLEELESTNANLKTERESESSSQENAKQMASDELDSLKARFAEIENENKDLESQLSEAKEELWVTIKEKEDASKVAGSAEAKMNEWESMMQMLQEERDRMEAELNQVKDIEMNNANELDDFNSSLNEALQERDTLKEHVYRLTEENVSGSEKVGRLNQILEEFRFERDELIQKNQMYQEEIKSMQNQVEQMNKDAELFNAENETLSSENGILKVTKKEQAEKLSAISKEKETLLSQIMDSSQSESDTVEKLTSMASELAALQAEKETFDDERNKIATEVQEMKRLVEISTADEKKWKKQLDDAKQQLESIVPEREMMEEKLKELPNMRRTIDNLSQENQNMKDKVETLQSGNDEMKSLQDKIDELDLSLKEKTRHATELTEKLQEKEEIEKDLGDKLNERDQQLADKTNEIEPMQIKVQELVAEVNQLRESMQQSSSEIDDKNTNITELSTQVAQLHEQIHQQETIVQEITREVETMETEKNDLLKQVADKDTESGDVAEALRQELKTISNENEKLVQQVSVQSEEMNALSQVAERKDAEIQDAHAKHVELETQFDQIQVRVKELEQCLETERTTAVSVSEQLQEMVQQKEVSLASTVEKMDQCKEELSSSHQEFSAYKEETQSMLIELEREKSNALDQLKDMKNAYETIKAGTDSSTQELMSVQEERLALKTELNNLKGDADKLREQMAGQADENDALKHKLSESNNKLLETDTLILSCKEQITTLLTQAESMKTEYETKVRDALSEAERYQIELTQSGETIEELKNKYSELELQMKESVGDMSGNLDNVQSELSGKDNIIENLTDELEKLTISKSVAEKERSQLQSSYETLSTDHCSLQNDLANKDAQLGQVTSQLDILREEQTQLTDKLLVASASNEDMLKAQNECQNLSRVIKEREAQIQQLETEKQSIQERLDDAIVELKDMKAKAEDSLQQSEASKESISNSKVEELGKQLKEREQREMKFKQLALKAKKECAEWKNKHEALLKESEGFKSKVSTLEKLAEEQKQQFQQTNQSTAQHVQNFQSLQTEYDRMENLLEEERLRSKKLENDMKQIVEEMGSLKVANAQISEEKQQLSSQLEAMKTSVQELENKSSAGAQEKEAERMIKEQMSSEKKELETKIEKLQRDLRNTSEEQQLKTAALQEQLKETASKLDQALKGAQQSNMMDLEIADYERTVQSLHDSVSEREGRIQDLQTEVTRLEERIKSLQTQRDQAESQFTQAEERGNKLKALLVKTKKDLAESKKVESEQKTSEAQMQGQMESLTQECEEYKIQIAGLVGENQKLSEKMRGMTDSQQRVSRSLDIRVQSLEGDLELTKSELTATQAEYEGYKVRVHSVLKQQKTKGPDEFSVEQGKQERERLQNALDQLKSKLQDASVQMEAMKNENDSIQEDMERLQVRHNKLLKDLDEKENSWRTRYDTLSAERATHNTEHIETIKQLSSQNEMLRMTFKEQTRVIQDDHQRTVEMLQRQADLADREICQLQNKLQSVPASSGMVTSSSAVSLEESRLSPEVIRDPRREERQSGEGMEHPDIESCNKTQLPAGLTSPTVGPGIVPFEQLLNSPADDTASLKTLESATYLNDEVLRKALVTAEKRIEHLSEVLNESEANSMRLAEQAKILKDEIRRLERNQARENAISNMEYLKNIVFKFLTLPGGDERTRLIPVLTTMLKLSPDEKQLLSHIADADAAAIAAGQGGDASGWGAYLHKWTGLS